MYNKSPSSLTLIQCAEDIAETFLVSVLFWAPLNLLNVFFFKIVFSLLDEALQKSREAKVKSVALRGGRHSRFGGTFVVHNHKSISGRDRIFHKPIAREFVCVFVFCVCVTFCV